MLQYLSPGSAERANLVVTLVELDEWAASVLAEGLEPVLRGIAGLPISATASDLIELIAEGLTRNAQGRQRDVLRKSIQETLYYSTGMEHALSRFDFEERLKRFLRGRGIAGFVRVFLSVHVFNVIWFQTSETSRATTDLHDSGLDIETVQRISRNIVQTLKHYLHPLTTASAEKLVAEISRRLQVLRG